MVGAIVLQILTGWARARALSGKSNNFSPFHRVSYFSCTTYHTVGAANHITSTESPQQQGVLHYPVFPPMRPVRSYFLQSTRFFCHFFYAYSCETMIPSPFALLGRRTSTSTSIPGGSLTWPGLRSVIAASRSSRARISSSSLRWILIFRSVTNASTRSRVRMWVLYILLGRGAI